MTIVTKINIYSLHNQPFRWPTPSAGLDPLLVITKSYSKSRGVKLVIKWITPLEFIFPVLHVDRPVTSDNLVQIWEIIAPSDSTLSNQVTLSKDNTCWSERKLKIVA